MSLSRTQKVERRELVFFKTVDEAEDFLDDIIDTCTVEDVKEVQGMVALIIRNLEVE